MSNFVLDLFPTPFSIINFGEESRQMNKKILDVIFEEKENNKSHTQIINGILESARQIARSISNIVHGLGDGKPRSLLFENQQNGYYIYGLDVLVRLNLEPVLVECNSQTGFSFHSLEKKAELSGIVYGWVNKTVLEPLFKHPGKATTWARKHKTYIHIDT